MVTNLPSEIELRRHGFNSWIRKTPWMRAWQATLVFLPGEFHAWRSLMGYSPRGREELYTTEQLTHTHIHTHTHLDILKYENQI